MEQKIKFTSVVLLMLNTRDHKKKVRTPPIPT